MAASSSVLGCSNDDACLAPLWLCRAPSAPSTDNFFGAGPIPFISFIAALINSRPVSSADALIFRTRFGRGLLLARREGFGLFWCFAGMTLFFSIEIDQGNDRAVDFVVCRAVRPHSE